MSYNCSLLNIYASKHKKQILILKNHKRNLTIFEIFIKLFEIKAKDEKFFSLMKISLLPNLTTDLILIIMLFLKLCNDKIFFL